MTQKLFTSIRSLARPIICFTALMVGVLSFTVTVPNAMAFNDQEQADIEAIIHNYLLDNPELLEEMVAAIRINDATRAKQHAIGEIAASYDAIFYPGAAFVAGNPTGDITLVEFFDYTCSFCRQSLSDVNKLIESDPNLRVVFIDFPALADRNPVSMLAARASVAAANQDKYVPYHLKLMGSITGLTNKNVVRYAAESGLDVEQLLEDMTATETYDRIDANIALAHRLGIDGTPSFVVGNQLVVGAQGYNVLKQAISRARNEKVN